MSQRQKKKKKKKKKKRIRICLILPNEISEHTYNNYKDHTISGLKEKFRIHIIYIYILYVPNKIGIEIDLSIQLKHHTRFSDS
jgi:hypothetical protein